MWFKVEDNSQRFWGYRQPQKLPSFSRLSCANNSCFMSDSPSETALSLYTAVNGLPHLSSTPKSSPGNGGWSSSFTNKISWLSQTASNMYHPYYLSKYKGIVRFVDHIKAYICKHFCLYFLRLKVSVEVTVSDAVSSAEASGFTDGRYTLNFGITGGLGRRCSKRRWLKAMDNHRFPGMLLS